LIAAVVVMGAAVAWVRFYGPTLDDLDDRSVAESAPAEPKLADYDVDIRVLPATASIAIDGAVIATGRYRASFPEDRAVHTVTFSAPDHTTVQRRFQGATTLEVSLEPLEPAPERIDVEPVEPAVVAAPAPREHRRERPRATANPPKQEVAPPAPPPADANPNGSGSAAQPARPKAADDTFAPATDNIDPFKTGN
jgi:hypothetical protein